MTSSDLQREKGLPWKEVGIMVGLESTLHWLIGRKGVRAAAIGLKDTGGTALRGIFSVASRYPYIAAAVIGGAFLLSKIRQRRESGY